MVVLCVPPLACWQDLRHDLAVLPPLLLHASRDVACCRFLLGVVVKYSTAVLRAGVWTLSVCGCGIVHAVEVLEELAVGELLGVEMDLESLGVTGTSGAYSAIARTIRVATDVAYASVEETFVAVFVAVHVLDAPEAAGGNGELLSAFGQAGLKGGTAGWIEVGGACAERPEKSGEESSHGCG